MKVKNIEIDNDRPFTLIAGPCVIEDIDHTLFMVDAIQQITQKLDIPFIYKSSFDKANRTSIDSNRGPGIVDGMAILSVIADLDVTVLTDVHTPDHCVIAESAGISVLQIPAFLCRQTDLLIAAGETGLPINVKKGQFLDPNDMKYVVDKIKSTGNNNVMLCERGTTFGYNKLVNDFTALPIMKEFGPVVFDATHSVQQPGNGGITGGNRLMVPTLARAAAALGVAAIFMEVHEDPECAPSDGANMVRLDKLEEILIELKAIDNVVK